MKYLICCTLLVLICGQAHTQSDRLTVNLGLGTGLQVAERDGGPTAAVEVNYRVGKVGRLAYGIGAGYLYQRVTVRDGEMELILLNPLIDGLFDNDQVSTVYQLNQSVVYVAPFLRLATGRFQHMVSVQPSYLIDANIDAMTYRKNGQGKPVGPPLAEATAELRERVFDTATSDNYRQFDLHHRFFTTVALSSQYALSPRFAIGLELRSLFNPLVLRVDRGLACGGTNRCINSGLPYIRREAAASVPILLLTAAYQL
ncbi:hypothetical protein [Neolewinella sp.]|uniref:hypothetical protein n=1 Tax=Neolewinella sp. TaxID=2993543 RepID=UPI003B52475D